MFLLVLRQAEVGATLVFKTYSLSEAFKTTSLLDLALKIVTEWKGRSTHSQTIELNP